MTEDSGRLLRFEYNIYVGCENSSFDIYSSRFDKNKRRNLKRNLKNRIGDYIGKKIGSIGNSYLLKEQTPDKSTNKGFLLGKRGGSISEKDSMQYVYDLAFLTVVDQEDSDKKEQIYYEILDKINGSVVELDMGVIFGSLSTSKTRAFNITVTEPQPPYKGDRYSNHDSQSLTSSIPKSAYADVDVVDQISSQGSVTDPVDVADNAENAEDILEDYDIDTQIESLKQDYNEEVTEVRKPTENEVEKIVDAVIERFEEICESDNQLYFDDSPEFWEAASCSHCQSTDSDIYHISQEKTRSILMTQLKQGFGITDDEGSKRQQSSKNLSNFYVSTNGEVLFRPEEVISWIVDYIHYVEPYCGDCHANIGGENHMEVRKNSETNAIDSNKQSSYSNLDTVDTDQNHKLGTKQSEDLIQFSDDTESINIQTDDVDQAQWTVYRSPKPSETEEITKRIVHHLYSLGTRSDISYKSQRDGIYRVIMKRGESENRDSPNTFQCEDCGGSIENEEKHHPIPLKLREAHMDVMNTVDVPPDSNPILVNESDNEYILSHKFLWRMESHISNLDIAAFKCSECTSSNSSRSEHREVQKTLSDIEVDHIGKSEIKDYLGGYAPDGNKAKHRIHCAFCEPEKGRDNSIVCRLNSDGRYETPRGSQTPVIKPERISISSGRAVGNIGICHEHIERLVEMIRAEDPENRNEVENQLKQSLMLMFNRKN